MKPSHVDVTGFRVNTLASGVNADAGA